MDLAGESSRGHRQLTRKAVAALTRELVPVRDVTFQIRHERSEEWVLPLVRVIRSIATRRLVTYSAA